MISAYTCVSCLRLTETAARCVCGGSLLCPVVIGRRELADSIPRRRAEPGGDGLAVFLLGAVVGMLLTFTVVGTRLFLRGF